MKTYFLVLFSLMAQYSFSQGEANYWYFGGGAGLDFSSGSPVAITDGQTNNQEGCASISNLLGELLFYSDGVNVWNRNHQIMQNGSGLLGHDSSTQSATIVPKPGTLDIYYVFTIDAIAGPNGFRYSIVDMSLNGGLGGVTTKNVLVYSPTCEKIAIVKKSNNIDYWIVTHGSNSNSFYAYEFTTFGLSASPVTSNVGSVVTASENDTRGYMKISPNGSKLALCSSGLGIVELFDFNNTTGVVSNSQIILTESGELYGLEFSTSNERLYVSNVLGRKIYQFNLSAVNIQASKVEIFASSQSPTALQLGPDGKIYIAVYGQNYMGVIHNPNNLGTTCNLQINAINLLGKIGFGGLPAFNQSFFFNSDIQFDNSCVGQNTVFEVNANQEITGIIWNFGDGSTSTDTNPIHVYTTPGQFTVTAEISSNLGIETKTKEITITQPPLVTVPNVIFCNNNNGTYTINTSDIETTIVGGQVGLVVNYFDSNGNLFPKPLPNPLITSSQGIKAEIYNVLAPNCVVNIDIPFSAHSSPNVVLNGNTLLCHNLPNQLINAEINDGTPVTDYSYQWFLNDEAIAGAVNYSLEVQNPGNYNVEVTNSVGCTSMAGITVTASDVATIAHIDVVDLSTSNSITVYTTGIGNYVYALDDNSTYQSENIFLNVSEGIHTVYVKDLNGCGTVLKEVTILSVPNYFTPNGDGINDFWNIQGMNTSRTENVQIYIYNRYGKLLKKINPISEGWNGTFNGEPMPSDDYWYSLTLNQREVKGHFTLKR